MIVELVVVVVVYGVVVVVLVRRRKEPKTNQPGKTQKDGIFSDSSFFLDFSLSDLYGLEIVF